MSAFARAWVERGREGKGNGKGTRRTSAVLGTLSQKISTLRSPSVVWSVTDMLAGVDLWFNG